MEGRRKRVPHSSSVCLTSPLFSRLILNLAIDKVHLVKPKREAVFVLHPNIDYSMSAAWEPVEISPTRYTEQEEEDARQVMAGFTFDSDEEDEEEDEEGTNRGGGRGGGFKFEAEFYELKPGIVEGMDLGQFVWGGGIAGF